METVLFFDVETNGLPSNDLQKTDIAETFKEWPRIWQLGWSLWNIDGTLISEGVWDKGQIDRNQLVIFEKEYNRDFPDFHKFIDTTMQCPMTLVQWNSLKERTQRRCSQMSANGANAPDMAMFPDGTDCYYLAIFDAYWKFWESQNGPN